MVSIFILFFFNLTSLKKFFSIIQLVVEFVIEMELVLVAFFICFVRFLDFINFQLFPFVIKEQEVLIVVGHLDELHSFKFVKNYSFAFASIHFLYVLLLIFVVIIVFVLIFSGICFLFVYRSVDAKFAGTYLSNSL